MQILDRSTCLHLTRRDTIFMMLKKGSSEKQDHSETEMKEKIEKDLVALGQTQLKPDILEISAPQIIRELSACETRLKHSSICFEWRTNFFMDFPLPLPVTKISPASGSEQCTDVLSISSLFRDPESLSLKFKPVSFRRSEKSKKRKTVTDVTDKTVQMIGARVACTAYELLTHRLEAFVSAVAENIPALRDRLRIGADITVRRTTASQHGTAASYEKHDPSAVHSDSWDGTILGFALVSTKLGTPVYPKAVFPSPVGMFLSQSRTGHNDAHQLDIRNIGQLRTWNPGSLVVMPAAVAHSKPSRQQITTDPEPSVPRWFCRATLRVGISGGFRSSGGRNEASREERLMLAILVSRFVWGDRNFAYAVEKLRHVPRKKWDVNYRASKMSHKTRPAQQNYDGDINSEGKPHGKGRLIYQNGVSFEGTWSHGKKHGQGMQISPCGRQYKGIWSHGKKHGPGTFTFKNGTVLDIIFRDGKPVDSKRLEEALQMDSAKS